MYVGKQYTATHEDRFTHSFRCVKCGHTCDAVVRGVGVGVGQSPYFTDDEGAAGRAGRQAKVDAAEDAELMLRLCPCPKCGARDARRFIQDTVAALVALPVGMGAVGFFVGGLKGAGGAAALVFGGMGLLLAPLYFFRGPWRKWTTAAERVEHLSTAGAGARRNRRRAKHRGRRRASRGWMQRPTLDACPGRDIRRSEWMYR